MKIGYPCINRSVDCKANRTFRLRSYSEERLVWTVQHNLSCTRTMLEYNTDRGIMFFRISSDLVPFASHPVCTFDWQAYFKKQFRSTGAFIKKHGIRISMHPDQFTLINSLDEEIFRKSVKELAYHAQVLDLMGLNRTAKIQIHVGGVYGDKQRSIKRFIRRYRLLDPEIKKRLVIENDHTSYTVNDCLAIHEQTGVPVLFDVFHHSINNDDRASARKAMAKVMPTWKTRDGLPMADYSSQKPGAATGSHAETINVRDFKRFLKETHGFDFDVMLEIKDKEKSALRALASLSQSYKL